MATLSIERSTVASEIQNILALEEAHAASATLRGESPPHPSLAVLYHEIAADDQRHISALERIAIRYGATPGSHHSSGVGRVLERIKTSIVELRTSAANLIAQDLLAKSEVIHWQTVWADLFASMNDETSAGELALILKEEQAHHDALLEAFKRVVREACESESE